MSRRTYERIFANKTQLAVGVSAAVGFLFLVLSNTTVSQPFTSSELAFSDASKSGLEIVPASCESSYEHFTGECTTVDYVPSQCSLTSSAWVISDDQSATLTWWGPNGAGLLGIPVTYVSGSISPGVGNVAQSGSVIVSPNVTTIYRYTGTQAWGGVFTSSFLCEATVTVVPACPEGQVRGGDGLCRSATCPVGQYLGNDGICRASTCPTGQVLGSDGLCYANNCSAPFLYCGTGAAANNIYQRTYSSAPACSPLDNFYATCRYGCSSGTCNAAPTTAGGNLSVRPSLVRVGDTTQVTWTSVDTLSCTVSAPNGDTWSGTSGTQVSRTISQPTVYTMSCVPRDGSTVTRTATVNVLPIFDEQ